MNSRSQSVSTGCSSSTQRPQTQPQVGVGADAPAALEDRAQRAEHHIGAEVRITDGEQIEAGNRPGARRIQDDDAIGLPPRDAVEHVPDQVRLRIEHHAAVAGFDVVQNAAGQQHRLAGPARPDHREMMPGRFGRQGNRSLAVGVASDEQASAFLAWQAAGDRDSPSHAKLNTRYRLVPTGQPRIEQFSGTEPATGPSRAPA